MLVKCKCGTEFDNVGKWSIRKFCSRKCANSRGPRTEETKRKQSLALTGRKYPERVVANWSKESRYVWRNKVQETYHRKYLNTNFENLGTKNKRKRILEEQGGVCNVCKLARWQEKPITFELEHKNGDRKDNRRENLELLCPNCHMLTDTWRGRNNKRPKQTVSNESLKAALRINRNSSEVLRQFGLADKGGNFRRVRRLLDEIYQET